ncbi:MAG TPA: hypothetical protein VGF88_22020 [Acidobacteriaceae bacterium]|jgi:hypothetical protein
MSPPPKDTNSPIRLPAILAIGFTGHRKLPDESRCRELIRKFLEHQKTATAGIVCGVSSAAAGGDLLFSESCLELNIPLRILLPMPPERFRNDFDAVTWERAQRVLNSAISVELTSDHEQRHEAYYECGIETVQQSQLLMALWDGKEARGMGGTAEIVAFAKAIGRPVVCFHSETGERQILNENAMAGLQHDSTMDFLNGLPDVGLAKPEGDGEPLIRAWFAKLDASASHFAPRARTLASVPVIYTAAAALFSGFAVRSPEASSLLAFSAALGVVAALLPAILRLDYWQMRWARTRTAAEVCRSMIALWNTPGPYNLVLPEMIPDLTGVLTSLNFLRMKDTGRRGVSLEQFRCAYREERLQEQIHYFSRKSEEAAREERLFRAIAWISGGLAVLIALWWFGGRLLGGSPRSHFAGRWIPLAISALFQIATVAGALVVVKDCNRRQQRYRELQQWLENWSPQFDALNTWGMVLQVATRVERALLVELLEWRSLMQHAKLPGK